MNFFGHTVCAAWTSRGPRFVLGSMLPDFCSMLGTRLPEIADDEIAEGVAHHQKVDGAFHYCATFIALSSEVTRALQGKVEKRGTALAVGHVGVELLLDGELALREETPRRYLDALQAGLTTDALTWKEEALTSRMREMMSMLIEHGLPTSYADVETTSSRLERVLIKRPRLMITEADKPHVLDSMTAIQPKVKAGASQALEEIRAKLGVKASGTPKTS